MNKYADAGLLILRIGIGTMFIYHGLPKIMGGPQGWGELGKVMGIFGINFMPQFWGFMAAFAEVIGGIAIILGVLMRPFCLLLVIDMVVATAMHLRKGDGLLVASHAIEMGIVFFSLIFIGAGRYTFYKILSRLH
jgi:putative oxidoreductase